MIPDITAGETISYTQSFSGFDPATDTLVFDCVTDGQQKTITATDNGDGTFKIDVAYTETDGWKDGLWHYQAHITDAGSARKFVENGSFSVAPKFAGMEDGFDNRSHVKQTLDALEATILGKASRDQLSYSVAGRTMSRLSPAELLEWRDKYRQFYRDELRGEKAAGGKDLSNKIFARMP